MRSSNRDLCVFNGISSIFVGGSTRVLYSPTLFVSQRSAQKDILSFSSMDDKHMFVILGKHYASYITDMINS